MTDAELLQQFAAGQRGTAFDELVRRYSGLVYNTAKRSSADEELAREVSQSVFLLLAEKAGRLHPKASLAGWLHHSALLLTRNAVRRKNRYLRALTAMESLSSPIPAIGPPDNCRHSVLPHLDQALERLPDRDREVLLAHYFSGNTYREIAAARHETEAAVQRRASRALEKLSTSLKRRGIVAPAIVLSTGLSAVLRTPAPAGLVNTGVLSPAVPTKVTGFPVDPIKVAILLLGTGFSCAAGYLLSGSGRVMSQEPASPRSRLTLAGPIVPDNLKPLAVPNSGPAGDWRAIVARAAEELRGGRNYFSGVRAAWMLGALEVQEFPAALEWAKSLQKEDRARGELADVLLRVWGKHDPEAAWKAFGVLSGEAESPALNKCGEILFLKCWDANPASCVADLALLKAGQKSATWAALKLHNHADDRKRWMVEVAAASPDGSRLSGAYLTLNHTRNRTENRRECYSWLISLPFHDANSADKMMDLFAGELAQLQPRPIEPVFSSWLDGLDASIAASARVRIQGAFLRASEENRFNLSRIIEDPELRRVLQESL